VTDHLPLFADPPSHSFRAERKHLAVLARREALAARVEAVIARLPAGLRTSIGDATARALAEAIADDEVSHATRQDLCAIRDALARWLSGRRTVREALRELREGRA
jgi:hypothetical protein